MARLSVCFPLYLINDRSPTKIVLRVVRRGLDKLISIMLPFFHTAQSSCKLTIEHNTIAINRFLIKEALSCSPGPTDMVIIVIKTNLKDTFKLAVVFALHF